MLLNLGYQQDLALLLFGDLERIGACNAFRGAMNIEIDAGKGI